MIGSKLVFLKKDVFDQLVNVYNKQFPENPVMFDDYGNGIMERS
jgi:hypothetical protein